MVAKKIVLLTTGQPSSNPRIVKEADAFHAAGYNVTLLYCFNINWAAKKDKVLLSKVSWKYKMVGGSPFSNKWAYLLTRLRFKAARMLNRYSVQSFSFAERAQARAYDELVKEAKKIKADWYVAHNLGALAVAVKAAGYYNSKAGFDFEDYYRGELPPEDLVNLKRVVYLEKKYTRSLHYFSAASTMILDAVVNDFPSLNIPCVVINNCFPLTQQPKYRAKEPDDASLRLFWFSQTIGVNRGLEFVIQALVEVNDPLISLTLAGRAHDTMLKYIEQVNVPVKKSIHFAGIIQPEELALFASAFDVGLALETGFSENNRMALSNKIFTYLLAGNAIILSATAMQSEFSRKYNVGELFPVNDVKALAEKINGYRDTRKLNFHKFHNYSLAKKELNWERESKKLLAIIH